MTEEICRICLKARSFIDLVDCQNNYNNIQNKLKQISNILICFDDELPNYLCIICIEKIDDFYDFKCLIERSDSILRTRIIQNSQSTNKSINLEILQDKKNESIININKCEKYNDKSRTLLDRLKKNFLFKINSNDKKSNLINENNFLNTNKNNLKCINNISLDKNIETPNKDKQIRRKLKSQCDLCGVVVLNCNLKPHLKTHSGEKPYNCDICKKSFASPFNLKIHLRIHTGEKPLKCRLCPMKFAHSASLAIHRRTHTGEIKYKCNLCPRTYQTSSSFKYHIITHTGNKEFPCSICEQRFITANDLRRHQKSHSDERPFICTICGIGLKRSYALKRHMESHNAIKNHKCNICNMEFLQKYDLKRHTNTHSKQLSPELSS